mgnify:FL=1|jgi:hypothetical protein|tara:strand:+ start:628 stop:1035 length:408 start_codon:yes stop_codon:yes gene_type:complete
MKFNARKLTDQDYSMLVDWWKWWRWSPPSKNLLPNNGTGGIIIEKNNIPVVAGFLYFTNSEMVLLEWIVSNPKYKESDRKDAIEMLINVSEQVCRKENKKYMFTIGRSKHLRETHEKLGWSVDTKSSYEIIKNLE